MEVARAASAMSDVDAELLAAYPALMRRLTVVLRDASEAEDVAQAAFTRALEHRHKFAGGDVRAMQVGVELHFGRADMAS